MGEKPILSYPQRVDAVLTPEGRRVLGLGPQEKFMTFPDRVAEELIKARKKFPDQQHSAHEGFAVLYEEVDELWDEVKKKQDNRNHARMLKELVQVAAMAQRMAEEVVMPKIEGVLHVRRYPED